MRTGPRPLHVHLGMAISSLPVFSGKSELALADEMGGELNKMLRGISKYQNHSYRPEQSSLPVVWEAGTLSIRKCSVEDAAHTIVLIPSIINRSGILDLCEQRSFTRWVASKGVNVYLLDWGDVSEDEMQENMEALVMKRLIPALKAVHEMEGGRPIHALGYCMGGTLLLGAAAHAPEIFNRLVLLASPWDFHAGRQDLLSRVKFWEPTIRPIIDAGLNLPVESVQTLFASLDPTIAARKFANFDDMDGESAEAELFIAVEDWLNDGVALPASFAKECIYGWFIRNITRRGAWCVGGKIIDPEQIDIETLIVTSDKDRLVEYASAAFLGGVLPNAHVLNTQCGHIGMVAGSQSIKKVWQPIADFIKN